MRVSVRLFAILRERAGRDSIELDLRDGATVSEALAALRKQPELCEPLAKMRVAMAVNRDYAGPETALRAGDELALVPPVSGGAGEPADVHVRLTEEPLSLERVIALVGRPTAGAIVSFQGTTRDVDSLNYEVYAEMAEERIAALLRDCIAEHGLEAAAAEHRIGTVPLGETSVVVAVSAAHRAEAFAGARRAIDRIKAEVPIWKRELEAGDVRWVEGAAAPEAG